MRFPSIFRRVIIIAGFAAMSVVPVRAVETPAAESAAPAAAAADSTICIVDRINASGNISVAEPEALTRLLTVAEAQIQARGEEGGETARPAKPRPSAPATASRCSTTTIPAPPAARLRHGSAAPRKPSPNGEPTYRSTRPTGR